MQAWYHCENVYPFVPQEVLDRADSVRASLPNKYCDPKIAADLFEECLDEHLLCDDLGVNVVSIEHHSGINSLYGASPMILGILARQTKKVRILSLGTLITVRPDPVRVAEEYATADVISRGRLEIGFVKSGDSEMVSGNANPVGYVERFWEAIDLIQKTLTSHDGPVQLGGQAFHPPPRQHLAAGRISGRTRRCGRRPAIPRPRPSSAGAAWSTRWCCAAPRRSKRAFDAYREARREAGLPAPGTDRFAYAALVLCRRHRRGGRAGRQQAAVVPQHQPQAVAADVEISAGPHAARGRGAELPDAAAARRQARAARPTA